MQSARGLWGQGAWFGKQPYYETCRSETRQTESLQSSFFVSLFIYEQLVFPCFGAIKTESEDELNPAGNKQILQVLFFILVKPQAPPT